MDRSFAICFFMLTYSQMEVSTKSLTVRNMSEVEKNNIFFVLMRQNPDCYTAIA